MKNHKFLIRFILIFVFMLIYSTFLISPQKSINYENSIEIYTPTIDGNDEKTILLSEIVIDPQNHKISLNGNGAPLIIDNKLKNILKLNPVDTIEVIDAPDSKIIDQTFENEQITIINSPRTQIINNEFFNNYAKTKEYSIIQVENSPDTVISGNIFSAITFAPENEIFHILNISNSNEVLVSENYISDLFCEELTTPAIISLINSIHSNNISVIFNSFEEIQYIGSFSTVSFNFINVLGYQNTEVIGNSFSSITFETEQNISVTGINIDNEIMYESLKVLVQDNVFQNILINTTSDCSSFLGISVESLEFGNPELNEVRIESNYFQDIFIESQLISSEANFTAQFRGISLYGFNNTVGPFIKDNNFNHVEILSALEDKNILNCFFLNNVNNASIVSSQIQQISANLIYTVILLNSYNTNITLEDPALGLLAWISSKPNFETYEVWLNSQLNDSSLYTPSKGIILNLDMLDVLQIYNFSFHLHSEALLLDFYDNVTIRIHDTTSPLITGTNFLQIEQGDLTAFLNYTITDPNLKFVRLFQNDSFLFENTTNSTLTNFLYPLNTLTPGEYRFRIEAEDISGNVRLFNSIIRIYDTTAPILEFLNQTNEINVERFTSTTLIWNVEDLNPGNYSIFLNDSLIISEIFQETIIFEFTNTTVGFYELFLDVHDLFGNSVNFSCNLIVKDSLAPVITSLDSITMFTTETKEIQWQFVDPSGLGNYSIYRNNVIISSGNASTNWVEITLSGMQEGVYYYTLFISDLFGNTSNRTVRVNVFQKYIDLLPADTDDASDDGIFSFGNIPLPAAIAAGVITVAVIGVAIYKFKSR